MIRRLILAAAFVFATPFGATAQRTLSIERFDADIQVLASGDVEIAETIRARFTGSWNGIFRNLSLEHRTGQNRRERLDVDLTSITDDQGNALEYESSRNGWVRQFKIWVPGANNATRTVVIRYTVHNAIRFFDEGNVGPLDELYWNVTGNEWEVPIEQAAARIRLPDNVVPTQSAGYTGAAGSRERAVTVETSGNVVTFTTTRGFAPGEGMTAAVGWAPGVVARPRTPSAIERALGQGLPLVLPLAAFALAFSAWRRTGRDPEPMAIPVQYEPPPLLTPAETGTLIDHKADPHDITSTLVDLAVRGFIHIEKKEESKLLGLISSTEYAFHLKKPRHEWRGLYEHEQLYLDALFDGVAERPKRGILRVFGAGEPEEVDTSGAGAGATYDSVELSSLKNKFYQDLSGIRKAIYTGLVSKGHYDREPERAKVGFIIAAILMVFLTIFGAGFIASSGFLGIAPPLFVAAGIASIIIFLVFAQLMPARTVRGARARERALGFKEFLSKVEEDRFRRMITSPEMFEKYLPYAMAFKVEERWAKAFEGMFTEPPQWCSGYATSGFHAGSFARDMNAMSTVASSTMSSSPSSSGSGGGGSSGGGSGGGGGGGF
jgi:hypothetical protein